LNIVFKISQSILISIFLILFSILIIFLYTQYTKKNTTGLNNYDFEADIINPKFIKEKLNDSNLEVIAKKASFIGENEILLEGNVRYSSDNFLLESDKVSFDKINFNASSNERTFFKSKKISIIAEGFNVEDQGNLVSFKGKSKLEIK